MLNQTSPFLYWKGRESEAATAAHKVGESTVELGTHYLREVLDIKDYLEEHELPKHGLRFFFKSNTKEDIASRVELGPRLRLPVPSPPARQGNCRKLPDEINDAKREPTCYSVQKFPGVDLDKEAGHKVSYIKAGEEITVKCRWVADASGPVQYHETQIAISKTNGASYQCCMVEAQRCY
jgi:hypothetical protein